MARPAPAPTRNALPFKTVARPKSSDAQEPLPGLSWLTTEGNLVLGEDGMPVLLRGVNVVGADEALTDTGAAPRDMLGLTDSALDQLVGTWGTNLVRLPLGVAAIRDDTAALDALDELTAVLGEAGLYTLLALSATPAGDHAAVPDDAVYSALGLLAARYRDAPGVLYELYASTLPQPEGWQDIAHRLIGAVRVEHPAALVMLSGESSGADVAGLPIRFATGDPVHNVIYTVKFEAGRSPAASDARFHAFAQTYPLLAATWSNGGSDFGRSAERAGQLFNRYGMGWVAAHWNAEPRLVRGAPQGDFTPTRFGLDALRALALPVRLALPPAAAAFGIAPVVRCAL
jgi:hypothetical protein